MTGRTSNPLPVDSPAIMMTEDEYSDEAVDNEEKLGSKMDPKERKQSNESIHSQHIHNNDDGIKAAHTINVDEEKYSIHFSSEEYPPTRSKVPVEYGNSMCKSMEECQPTSSKVLVEDLITDEDDEEHEHDFHVQIEPDTPCQTRIQF